jgi:transposase
VTAGQEADCSNYDVLMEARDSDPAIMLGDKGYDSDPIRQDLRDRGAVPEIPTKRNRHVQHSVRRPLYALRSRIECFINRLKNSRRVATRYDQTADSFLGFATLASIRLWIRFVHATWPPSVYGSGLSTRPNITVAVCAFGGRVVRRLGGRDARLTRSGRMRA